ncbi:MAG: DEAD/DEAH box helicase [Acidobacteriia bacterium]|nr:DEAD/DEAH box helicase [Terriglobia bacterium]MYG01805.1 DEAD/DEAH box helicase [Terriglobia bacterium]MYK09006.1 DEAD/DEAH box helicase [Terriglobia bacterium]
MDGTPQFRPGDLVRVRGREWVVLPETRADLLKVRPLGGAEDDATLIYLPLEPEPPTAATFGLPDAQEPGSQQAALLLRDALRLKLRAGAGPFRSFGNLNVEPRAYQLVPLLMALKLDTVRLLIADDVGIGKTIEAGLIARELIDRGEIERLAVICPPHLCEQWQQELAEKFSIEAEVVRTGTATRLERGLRPDESIFEVYPYTVVSLDYIKSDRRRDDFLRACPEFVIVDEAHTCVQSNTNTRHQRYQLLKGLAESEPRRQMVFLTATPHSGDDTAFHNLLGLLEPRFVELAEMPEGVARESLRIELARHFVQRRRGDIAEWKDDAAFPSRESREATYRLTGSWGGLFDEVLTYARGMVQQAASGSRLEQRMSWWAALALLRCVSSSPAAASLALRTRLLAAEGETEQAQVVDLDRAASETVMDESADDSLTLNESVPAGTLEAAEDVLALKELITRTDALRGPGRDPKLKALIGEVRQLIAAGFKPVVFCRYIATAHYAGEELKRALPKETAHIAVVTGELTSDQREERVEALGELDKQLTPILVATDCLSEGVNLQGQFDAVVHYDLTWNPTRHEQREGRADRFGQASSVVRALMLYGENNPVDGAVLRVILRKAEKIRKELGVAVPLPADNNKVVDAIMKAVLLSSADSTQVRQMLFDFGDTEVEVDNAWRTAKDKMTRTVFAQRRLRPDQVLPEWRKSVSVLGGQDDVARFVRVSAERLGAGIDERNGYSRLPVAHFPKPLQDRLNAFGFKPTAKISFERPSPAGASYIHRSHPLVATLADYVAEQALDASRPEIGARASAMFTRDVEARTVLYLLRLRTQIQVERRDGGGRYALLKSLLAEECLGIAVRSGEAPALVTEDDALSLLSLTPGRNMEDGQKSQLIGQTLKSLHSLEPVFERIAQERAQELLADHRRIREASDTRGLRYNVIPALPVDKIGVYVFMPMVSL